MPEAISSLERAIKIIGDDVRRDKNLFFRRIQCVDSSLRCGQGRLKGAIGDHGVNTEALQLLSREVSNHGGYHNPATSNCLGNCIEAPMSKGLVRDVVTILLNGNLTQ